MSPLPRPGIEAGVSSDALRNLPAVNAIADAETLAATVADMGREAVVEATRVVLDRARATMERIVHNTGKLGESDQYTMYLLMRDQMHELLRPHIPARFVEEMRGLAAFSEKTLASEAANGLRAEQRDAIVARETDSGIVPLNLPAGARLRLLFEVPGDVASQGYVFGLDNLELRSVAQGDTNADTSSR